MHEVQVENGVTSVVAVQFSTATHRTNSNRWYAMIGGEGGILTIAGTSPADAKTRMSAALRKIADELDRAT